MQLVQLQHRLDDSIMTQRTLHIRIGEVDVKLAMDQATARIRKKVTVPGFRKGKAPASVVRNHHSARVESIAFEELRKAAVDQIVKKLDKKDQPFMPTEVVNPDEVRMRYGRHLEFTLNYLVDPSGMSAKPEDPSKLFNPLGQIHAQIGQGMPQGAPRSPAYPSAPQTPGSPKLPSIPSAAKGRN